MGVEFDETTHTYRIDGKVWPSVTQILQDLGFMSDFYAAGSSTRGKDVHLITRLYEEGRLDWTRIDEAYVGYLDAWISFLRKEPWETEKCEVITSHQLLGYAGTIDRMGNWKAYKAILDIKSGVPENWHALQLIGYALTKQYETIIGVYLKKDGTYKVREYKYAPKNWQACVRVYRLKNGPA